MAALIACTLVVVLPAQAGGKIDINTATVEQLQSVKGIGAKTAEAIVAYRNEHGMFHSVDDLGEVKGIGKKNLVKFKDGLTVGKQGKHN